MKERGARWTALSRSKKVQKKLFGKTEPVCASLLTDPPAGTWIRELFKGEGGRNTSPRKLEAQAGRVDPRSWHSCWWEFLRPGSRKIDHSKSEDQRQDIWRLVPCMRIHFKCKIRKGRDSSPRLETAKSYLERRADVYIQTRENLLVFFCGSQNPTG